MAAAPPDWYLCAMEAVGNQWRPHGCHLRVLSLCSGMLPEAEVLAELGVSHTLTTCDLKASAAAVACRLPHERHDHHYRDVWDLLQDGVQSAWCERRKQLCPLPSEVDILVAGFPCQPYSRQNCFKRKFGLDPMTVAIVDAIRRYRPARFVLENVTGMLDRSQNHISPYEEFCHELSALPYHVESFTLQLSVWVQAERERPRGL